MACLFQSAQGSFRALPCLFLQNQAPAKAFVSESAHGMRSCLGSSAGNSNHEHSGRDCSNMHMRKPGILQELPACLRKSNNSQTGLFFPMCKAFFLSQSAKNYSLHPGFFQSL